MTKKIAVLVATIIYSLLFGEIFLRIFSPTPLIPRFVTAGENGIRTNIPNVTYRHITPEVDVELRINSQGIRADKVIPTRKPDDVYRIVLLGDSFFMGYESSLEDSFAGLLPELIDDCSKKNVEVVNLAVSGFGTAESIIMLESRGLAFRPDLVVMQWHESDIADNIRSGLFTVQGGELKQTATQYLPAVEMRDQLSKVPGYRYIVQYSHLYTAARDRVSIFVKSLLVSLRMSGGEAEQSQKPAHIQNTEKRFGLNELLLATGARISRNADADFVVFDVPLAIEDFFVSSLEKLDIEAMDNLHFISPLAEFEHAARQKKQIYLKRGHGHWTTEGNRIAAASLADFVISEGLCRDT